MPRDDCAQPEVARKDLETEIDILQRLQHPNIVEMLGAGFVNPLDVDAADGEDRGEFRDADQASLGGGGGGFLAFIQREGFLAVCPRLGSDLRQALRRCCWWRGWWVGC